MIIRENTIKYSSQKKKTMLNEEFKLEQEIKRLEEEINTHFLTVDESKIQSLIEKREELISIEGVMLRSRCRYQDLGENPTNYIFNLENRSYTSKVMNKLIVDSTDFTETEDILNCQTQFYSNLYSENNDLTDEIIETYIGKNEKKLSDIGDKTMTSSIRIAKGIPGLVGKKVGSQSRYIQHLRGNVKILLRAGLTADYRGHLCLV